MKQIYFLIDLMLSGKNNMKHEYLRTFSPILDYYNNCEIYSLNCCTLDLTMQELSNSSLSKWITVCGHKSKDRISNLSPFFIYLFTFILILSKHE